MEQDLNMIKRHIRTHTERSVDDQSAVSILKTFLRSNGKINSHFAEGDKWPNTDGTFELVSNPDVSRNPLQSFIVQIKGTHLCDEENGVVKYQLQSLAFPAFIYEEVTLDPGILFVVLNCNSRGKERVFWKYISVDFLSSVDFSKDSKVIPFTLDDEIKNTDESVNLFCEKLEGISSNHSFVKRLANRPCSEMEVMKIIKIRSQTVIQNIDLIDNDVALTRDEASKLILMHLEDICKATLLLNAMRLGCDNPNLRLAWEKALLSRETKYLCVFLRGLRYIDSRIPEDGQSERLMLKYYDFLWQIRNFLCRTFNVCILGNLENFPLNIDEVDQEYYDMLAGKIETVHQKNSMLPSSRFYVQKRTPFFVGQERYYEITLQLAGLYSTKYDRITVYSKENIDSGYSVQIGCQDVEIDLWGVRSNIKVITNWWVSIDPVCLNKLGRILGIPLKLNSKYGEYQSLMAFLTETGINLLQFMDIGVEQFNSCIEHIYKAANTDSFKRVLLTLRKDYSRKSTFSGRYTIRWLLLNLKEDTLEKALPSYYNPKQLRSPLYLSSRCYPFEKNPFIENLVGTKTTSLSRLSDVQNVAGMELYNKCRPYVVLKNRINSTREIYFPLDEIASQEKIDEFNDSLDSWQRTNGDAIIQENGVVYIESFEKTTIQLLRKILCCSVKGNKGQKELNNKFVKTIEKVKEFDDPLKKYVLQNVFVNSQIVLIYGAAGTGKTKLINDISNLMGSKRKLFLTKTHTTLQNLKRRIENPGTDFDFVSIDRFTKKVSLESYDVIFVDECTIIDNDIMLKFMSKITENTFLVFAGDVFQIESINFGNWFFYAKDIIKTNGANIELTNTWRTEDKTLKDLWNEVRVKAPLVIEKLAIDGEFSENIGEGVFAKEDEDEVVLCLHYDGKFGLNNINQYFQNANEKGEVITWKEWGYKIGDPVIFNDVKRFNLLYNNLKGRIVNIIKEENHIVFTLDINLLLSEADCNKDGIEFIDITDETTRISFSVFAFDDSEEESEIDRSETIVPFQIAYAISIHKAQGLEFNSVKVVIPSNDSERITHDVFYTAITRAKKKLKIFWSSETMKAVVEEFSLDKHPNKSLGIIKSKL